MVQKITYKLLVDVTNVPVHPLSVLETQALEAHEQGSYALLQLLYVRIVARTFRTVGLSRFIGAMLRSDLLGGRNS